MHLERTSVHYAKIEPIQFPELSFAGRWRPVTTVLVILTDQGFSGTTGFKKEMQFARVNFDTPTQLLLKWLGFCLSETKIGDRK